MGSTDLVQLLDDVRAVLARDPRSTFGIVGHTPVTYELIAFFGYVGASGRLLGVYDEYGRVAPPAGGIYRPTAALREDRPDAVIVASDADKERLLERAAPHLSPETRVIFSGHAHFAFCDPTFDDAVRGALVPSLANGYPYSLVHIFECLRNAARLELEGVVAEFGMFKGGTTMLLAGFIERLGQSWPVIGFDTFAGFPSKRSVLDMYAHPDCVFTDEALVRRLVGGHRIEVVAGDLVTTASRMEGEDIVLAFVDTDNFTPAAAVLDVIQDQIVVGGAIVFDHFTGRERHRYTLGERIAARRLLDDARYFHLHDTGVFYRQR